MLPSSALGETLSKLIKLQVEMNGTQQQETLTIVNHLSQTCQA
jgi:hypothetical protein